MSKMALLLLTVAVAFAADDPWTKVKNLKSGTEIRVLKKGSMQPVLGKIDEATDENLIVVVKNEQIAIAKDLIDRLDFRPAQPGGRFVKETTTKVDDSNQSKEPPAGMNHQSIGPGYSSGTSVNIQGKPDFETLYRRPLGAPKK
jgi:hypothetical protein